MDRPRPLTPDRRIPTWIAFLLGMGGVLVTVAGIYELTRRHNPEPPAPNALEVENARLRAELAQLGNPATTADTQLRARAVLQRQEAIHKVRQQRAAELRAKGARCINGTIIIREGNELRSAGRCH